MLTASPDQRLDPTPEGLSIRIDVAATVVRLALLYVAEDCGWRLCEHSGSCGCVVVSDRLDAAVHVLVTPDLPGPCQRAIEAAMAGDVSGVVLWNDPAGLAAACGGMASGLMVIPRRVVELAALAPRLSDRQRDTLRLLAAGRSSRSIAGALHQSESTAKRDIAELLDLFDAPNRTALVMSATELGFVRQAPTSAVSSG